MTLITTKIQSLNRFWSLTLSLAIAEFKLKNEGSYLGILWYLLNPLLMFALLFFIFADRLGARIDNYPVYLLIGIIMFNFFQQITTESTKIIIDNSNLIKSIAFPREILISSIVLKTIFSHIFEVAAFLVFLIILGTSITGLVLYPLILFFFCLFVYGFSLILSALTVYFIDLDNIWLFVVRLLWFATPIFYAIEGQSQLFILNLFNPVYYFITIARSIIVYAEMPSNWLMVGAIGYSLLFLIIGLSIFSKLKVKFAEKI